MPTDQSGLKGARASFRFQADGAVVRHVLRRALERFAPLISALDARTLELALAEVLNNIVEHAYGDQGKGRISLTLWHQDLTLSCTVIDEGRAMPGLTLPAGGMPEIAARIEDLAEGGWGWAMILALTRDIHYERQGSRNRLSFNVPLTAAF